MPEADMPANPDVADLRLTLSSLRAENERLKAELDLANHRADKNWEAVDIAADPNLVATVQVWKERAERAESRLTGLQALVEQWRAYMATSELAFTAAQKRRDKYEMASRDAEAATLGVCIADLSALLGGQGDETPSVRTPGETN